MKKFLPVIFAALCLCGCESKIAPQNPDIKLSEEHGKMLNLIVNLSESYSDLNINFDTSSDNYLCQVRYSDYESRKVESIFVYHMKYCNGVVTDIMTYTYRNGVTVSRPNADLHVRWSETGITVRKYGSSCRYPLSDPNGLSTTCKYWTVAPAAEIKKIDDRNYFYRRSWPGKYDSMFSTAYDGPNYIEYDTLEGEGDRVFDVLRFWNKDETLCCRFYVNGSVKLDNQHKRGVCFTSGGDLASGYAYHFDDEKNEVRWPISRKYDGEGRLVYEECLMDKGAARVTVISKTLPDVRDFSPDLDAQINLDDPVIEKD